ncbi:MAG: O-antigen ligase family protein [Candidatus Paceibacterota bacterium]
MQIIDKIMVMDNQPTTTEEPFLVKVIRWGVYISLLTPLIVSGRFFFPYVGPKGIFFMALAQIIFFSWLYLAINYEQYRPKLNSILATATLFLAVLGISAAFGTDPSRSFWSKFERMSGILFHLHLLGYLFAVSSTFKFKKDWNRFFAASLLVGMVVSVIYFLARFGVDMGVMAAKKGSSLGNSSFLGTYLMFDVYLAILLFLRSKKQFLRGLAVMGFVISGIALLMSSAMAAKLSFLGGLFLIGMFYLIFKRPEKKIKIAASIALLIIAVAFLTAVFHQQSPVHKELVERLGAPRFAVWRMAWDGFLEKPLLGWGSNNFIMVYSKFYDPYKPVAGGAPWFDRAHNIVMNYLATTGILGLLSYLSLYAAAFYILIKRYWKRNKFWVPATITAYLIAYFIHLLTVFDMPVSYMMFFLLLAFVGSYKARPAKKIKYKPQKYGVGAVIALLFVASFWSFVVRPTKAGTGTIRAIQTVPQQKTIQQAQKNNPNQVGQFLKQNSERRLELYKNTLNASPMGKYQIRNFFAQHSRNFVRDNIKILSEETAKKEMDFTISKLEQSHKESPNDLKTLMNLIQGYAVYSSYDQKKMDKAIQYAKEATKTAPHHQYGYWVLAQIYTRQRNFDKALSYAEQALNLERSVPRSQILYIQTAMQAGKMELAKEQAQKAVQISPEVKKQVEKLFGTSTENIK